MTGYDFGGKRVFLSGPMTGMPDWNRAAFGDAENRLCEQGAVWVYNPAQCAPRTDFDPYGHAYWMAESLHELTALPEHRGDSGFAPCYDAIALLPGWEHSEGARVERMVAEACGIEAVEL